MLNNREVLFLDVKLIKTKTRRRRQAGGFILQANKHIILFVLLIVFMLGLFLGHTFVRNNFELNDAIKMSFSDYINDISVQPFVKIMLSQILINAVVLLATFVFGLCAVGFPLPIITLLVKGLGIGGLSSYIYSAYGLKGFGFCMLIFYPIQIVICIVLLRSGKASFEMSMNILKYISIGRLKTGEYVDFKIYFISYSIYLIAITAISLISTVLLKYLLPLFNF